MTRKILIIAMFLMAGAIVKADPIPLSLDVHITNPGDDDIPRDNSKPRTPVLAPSVYQDGNTLYLYSGCTGATLRLLDEDEEVGYSVEITDEMDEICIPSTFVGTYRLEIVRGAFTFYCEIEL